MRRAQLLVNDKIDALSFSGAHLVAEYARIVARQWAESNLRQEADTSYLNAQR